MYGFYEVLVLHPRTQEAVRRVYFNTKEQAEVFVAKVEMEGYLTETLQLAGSR